MRWPWSDYSLLREQLAKAETRAGVAESALVKEREARMRDVRHVIGAWLRHERAVPLPPTAEEKAEIESNRKPPPLSADKIAQRDALRLEAQRLGISTEEADEKFAQMTDLEQ